MLRALEHEVLEEMRKSPLVPFFILGTDVIPEIYGHERQAGLAPEDRRPGRCRVSALENSKSGNCMG